MSLFKLLSQESMQSPECQRKHTVKELDLKHEFAHSNIIQTETEPYYRQQCFSNTEEKGAGGNTVGLSHA